MKIRNIMFGALLAFTASCGSDDGNSGVDSSKALSSVTDDEAKAICESATDEDALTKLDCYFTAAFADTTVEMCETAAQECVDAATTTENACDDAAASDIPSGCTATVGEMESCLNDQTAAVRSVVDGLTCANLGERIEGAQSEIASCTALEAKCPGIFDDDDGSISE